MEVPAVRQERRRGKDEEAAWRVLDEKIAVGDPSVEERLAVVPVEADVAEAPPAEEPTGRNRSR
jgi:hypothetical protein